MKLIFKALSVLLLGLGVAVFLTSQITLFAGFSIDIGSQSMLLGEICNGQIIVEYISSARNEVLDGVKVAQTWRREFYSAHTEIPYSEDDPHAPKRETLKLSYAFSQQQPLTDGSVVMVTDVVLLVAAWLMGVAAAAPALSWCAFFLVRREFRRRRGRCTACGYDLRGSASAPRCPECGSDLKRPSESPTVAPRT